MSSTEHDLGEALDADFLAGGGEMGERIRRYNWAPTRLGPLPNWRMLLRLAVNHCVKSPLPVIVHWGWPDPNVLYNDAFIPLIGERHPRRLARGYTIHGQSCVLRRKQAWKGC
jgi:hypothetical protein